MPYNLIEYNGKRLTLNAIAKKEGIIERTLNRYYKHTNGNIYIAVNLCKRASRGKVNKVEYNGELLAISVIAQRVNLSFEQLKNTYLETHDIYEAIKICNQKKSERIELREERRQKKQSRLKDYDGIQMTLMEIAQKENIDSPKLREYYNETQDVYKAISMLKIEDIKNKKVQFNNLQMDLYDISILLNIKYRDLINLINSGLSINEIKEEYKATDLAEQIKLQNKTGLLEFCVKRKLDFSFLYRTINTYGRSLPEAIQECEKKDRIFPISWISQRYDKLFEEGQISTYQGIAIVRELQYNKKSLEEAIEICILRKNARNYNISERWGETIYGISMARRILGEQYERKVQINDSEQAFINKSEQEINNMITKLKEISKLH